MLDIFFIGFFIFQAIRGYQKGVFLQLVWLLTIVVLFAVWPIIEPFVYPLFQGFVTATPNEILLKIIPFVVSYLFLYLIFQIILSLGNKVKVPILTPLNRLLGSIFAIAKTSFFLFLVTNLLVIFIPEWSQVVTQTLTWQILTALWNPIMTWLSQWLSVWSQNVV